MLKRGLKHSVAKLVGFVFRGLVIDKYYQFQNPSKGKRKSKDIFLVVNNKEVPNSLSFCVALSK